MVPIVLLSVPVMFSLVFFLGYSLRNRGVFDTIFIFVLGLVFFAVKENLQVYKLLLEHEYTATAKAILNIGKVPAAIVLGHLFTINTAWGLSERIFSRNNRTKGLLLLTLPFVAIITSSLSYTMEIVGTAAGWWTWVSPAPTSCSIYVPINPVYLGWPIYVFGFMAPRILMEFFNLRKSYLFILIGHAVFFATIVFQSLTYVTIVLFALCFVYSLYSKKRTWSDQNGPTDLTLIRLPSRIAWVFDHALPIAVSLNLAVVFIVLVVRGSGPTIPFPVVTWILFCVMGTLPVPLVPLVISVSFMGVLSLFDPTGHMSISLFSIFIGLFLVLSPLATKRWRLAMWPAALLTYLGAVIPELEMTVMQWYPAAYVFLLLLFIYGWRRRYGRIDCWAT